NARHGAAFEIRAVAEDCREADRDYAPCARASTRDLQHDASPEGESCQRKQQTRVPAPKIAESGARVLCLTFSVSVSAFALRNAAVIESQHHCAGAPETSGDAEDHFVVHGAAVLGMRMADQRGFTRRGILGLFKQGF